MLPANPVLVFDSTKFILLLYCAHICVPLFFINFVVHCCKKKVPKSIIEEPPTDMMSGVKKAAIKQKAVKGKTGVIKQKATKGKTAVKTVKGKTTRRR